MLGIAPPQTASGAAAEVLAGNRLLAGMQPYAARYGGHQFGQWAGQLGDGRAITLGEVIGADDMRYDLMASGIYDSVDNEPADKRMLIASGPFNLAYGDSVQFVVAIVFAWPEWYFNPSIKGQLDHYADYLKLAAANGILLSP